MEKYSFIVDLGKNNGRNGNYNQILFCNCGNKQKTKITVKRTIIKNSETFYEDKYSVEELVCSNCKKTFNFGNNLYGLKKHQKALVDVEFQKEKIKLKNNEFSILKKNKKYYYFDLKSEELKSFTLTDFIYYDKKTNKIKFYLNESMLDPNFLNFEEEKNKNSGVLNYNLKQNKLLVYNIEKNCIMEAFFDFDDCINYNNLPTCYDYFDELLKNTYEYDDLMKETFFLKFKISSKIEEVKKDMFTQKFINIPDPFGGKKLIQKKLNTGDYLNKLIKMSNITSIFITFPSISTLYRTKGLDFLYEGFRKDFFCNESILRYNNATNTNRILEVCSKNYNRSIIHNYKVFHNDKNQRIDTKEDFKISSLLIKNFKDTDDVLIVYNFFMKKILNKKEIENLFLKYDSDNVLRVLSKIVGTTNLRAIQLKTTHINHILKNKLFTQNDDEWLTIYYDTINTINLIVDILKVKKDGDKTVKKYNNIIRISENKLFETKNFTKLKDLHDEMVAIYRAMEDESKDEIFRNVVKKFKDLNMIFNHFEFKVIPNLKELSQEGLVMKHCIYTYLNDIMNGNYLAIRIKDKVSREKATMGIKLENNNLYLQQLKGYENSRPTVLLIQNVLEYCEKHKINSQSHHLHKTDIQPNESLEKRMKNYISKEEAKLKRKKLSK